MPKSTSINEIAECSVWFQEYAARYIFIRSAAIACRFESRPCMIRGLDSPRSFIRPVDSCWQDAPVLVIHVY